MGPARRRFASAVAASTGRRSSCTATWLEEGREPPPVRLARAGEILYVRDGRHRITAALVAGHTVIEAEVRET